jgi:hypothetical protein
MRAGECPRVSARKIIFENLAHSPPEAQLDTNSILVVLFFGGVTNYIGWVSG